MTDTTIAGDDIANVPDAVNATMDRRANELRLYDPDMDFRKLALEATYFSKGYRLVHKEDLEAVPHVIIGVTYREGFSRAGAAGDYVSVEAVVGDKDTLALPQVRAMRAGLPELTVYPNESVVYNDSSTGIRRALTQLFQQIGLIDVGKPRNKDENPFDKPYQFWAAGDELATSGIITDANGEKFRYVAMRGLNKSEYKWKDPHGKEQPATTWYFG